MNLTNRSQEKEWIDFGLTHYNVDEYQDCLFKMDRVGRFLGGDAATLKAFNRLKIPFFIYNT